MREKQILVVIKEPGKAPVVDPLFDNELKAFWKAVGGYIETVTIASDLVIICNEEGRLHKLPHNCEVLGIDFVGTILAVGLRIHQSTACTHSTAPAGREKERWLRNITKGIPFIPLTKLPSKTLCISETRYTTQAGLSLCSFRI